MTPKFKNHNGTGAYDTVLPLQITFAVKRCLVGWRGSGVDVRLALLAGQLCRGLESWDSRDLPTNPHGINRPTARNPGLLLLYNYRRYRVFSIHASV